MNIKIQMHRWLILILLVSNASCQNLEKMGESEKRFKEIPKEIKKYKSQPEYLISGTGLRSTGAVEIYVNDIPFRKYYKGDNSAGYFSINQYILKSGKQEIRLVYKKENNIAYKGDFIGGLSMYRMDKNDEDFRDDKEIVDYEVPRVKVDSTDTYGDFVGEGLMEFTDTIEFEAEVPYELEGWSESEDLSKLDKDKLLKETVGAYEEIIDKAKSKDREYIFGLFYSGEYEIDQSEYNEEDIFKKRVAGFDFMLENESVNFLPLENYELKLYGNGRVVALESNIKKGKSAIMFNLESKDKRTGDEVSGTSYMKVLLHKPKGSNKLVPIR